MENHSTQHQMENLPVRACSIICKAHPEWGTFGIQEDHGSYYDIIGKSGSCVLHKSEAIRFWAVK